MYNKQERENLDIIFRQTSPRLILKDITDNIFKLELKKSDMSVRFDQYSGKAYDYFGQLNLKNYSIDETKMRFNALKDEIRGYKDAYIFGMLAAYSDKVLDIVDGNLVCKMEEILNWNSISSRLGQDIFTTAWVAKYDSEKNALKKRRFDWYSILKTDDFKLNNILKRGMAENHYHLHGSTQSFSLSWIFIMNYPEKIREIYQKNPQLSQRYVVTISENISDNTISDTDMLVYAAYIRTLLFNRCIGQSTKQISEDKYKKFDEMDSDIRESNVKNEVRLLRFIYGHKFEQMNKKKKCLDYAICEELYYVDSSLSIRLLCGERAFLYLCFRLVYENKMSALELMMFHAYLVIKSNFRGEIVQINNRTGFDNFSKYQDRKNAIFGDNDEYWEESLRLSVANAFNENNLKVLEARIMPKDSANKMNLEIKTMDKLIQNGRVEDLSKFAYITHFAKSSIIYDNKDIKDQIPLPRNHAVRERVEKQAKALKDYFTGRYAKSLEDCLNHNMENNRICAIDACSNEIGCRPEVFATAFRYLRNKQTKFELFEKEQLAADKDINVTYHVGEDFLDICDGIRAIDEAVNFLNMKKGDRLGHALALGISAKEYYLFKEFEIYMPKQDILDNCIWLLYRSLEWNIEIDSNKREVLKQKANELIQEIFGFDESSEYKQEKDNLMRNYSNILQIYYHSWQLRGDAPELYINGRYQELSDNGIPGGYTEYMRNGNKLDIYRNNPYVTWFYHMYHYDKNVEEIGLKSEGFHVEKWYIDLIDKFQEYLIGDIARSGISIECNPTSNLRIGSFSQYYQHPITRFNNFYLEKESRKVQLEVSINTDDLGVFDTSIENEYALLLSAICRQRHNEGNYNDEEVYAYFEHVRKKSLQMSFIEVDGEEKNTR